MTYIFDPQPTPSLPIEGIDLRFPVRRIFCVGRNYAEHAREMGHDAEREEPFFFTKPSDALVQHGETVAFPTLTANLHHEAELVVAIALGGRDIPHSSALDHVYGYAVGNDLTRRDLQATAKAHGRPWDWGKAFDQSAPVGAISPVSADSNPLDAQITAHVNGQVKQRAMTSDMIWSVPEIIASLSCAVEVMPGDLIFTGTPAGVGPLVAGDVVEIRVDGLAPVTTTFAR